MKSFIPWVGGKSKLLWLIHKLSPSRYSRFIDVFGGSGTVTLSRPIQQGCMEVYNDFNGDLTNLFCCVKNRTMALLLELGFLPLNTRDDFNVLYKFFSREEFTDDYLDEEMELTQRYLEPPDAKTIRRMMLERAPRGDVRRAADYFKLIRYSFSGGAKSFAGKSCDIRRFFHLVWECSRRLAEVVIENKDCVDLIRQYDREDAFFYRAAKTVLQDVYALDEEHAEAVRVLEQLWVEGYTVAAHQLGKFYRDDLSTMRDHEKAERWFRLSAEAGNDFSAYALGKLLLSQKRTDEAVRWLDKAAGHGNPFAQYRLGKLCLTGESVKKDVRKALEYLTAAARQGNPFAQYTLGKLYLLGRDVEQDREQARDWFTRSAAQGNAYAQFFLDRFDQFRDPSVMLAATKLLHHMSRIFRDNSMPPHNPAGIRIDSKRRKRLTEKRMAMGHKADDHEEQVSYQQTM